MPREKRERTNYKFAPYQQRVASKVASDKISEIIADEDRESGKDIENSKFNSGLRSIEAAMKSPLRNDTELLLTVGSKWKWYVEDRINEENNQVNAKER